MNKPYSNWMGKESFYPFEAMEPKMEYYNLNPMTYGGMCPMQQQYMWPPCMGGMYGNIPYFQMNPQNTAPFINLRTVKLEEVTD